MRRAGPLEPVLDGLLRRDPHERLGYDEAERLLRAAAVQPAPAPPAPGPLPNPEPRGLNTTLGHGGEGTQPPGPAPGPQPSPQPGPSPLPEPPEPPEPGSRRRRWELIVPAGIFAVALVAAAVVFAVFVDGGGNGGPRGTPTAHPATSGGSGIPPGYHRYEGSAFVAAVPDGWTADGSGDDVTFAAPERGATRGVAVTRAKPGPFDTGDPGDALAEATKDFGAKDSGYPDYKQIYFHRKVPYQGKDAAEIEFTFTKNGTPGRARVRVFPFDGALYQVILAADQAHWDATVPVYETFLASFRSSG
jgi:hypothetical protein